MSEIINFKTRKTTISLTFIDQIKVPLLIGHSPSLKENYLKLKRQSGPYTVRSI